MNIVYDAPSRCCLMARKGGRLEWYTVKKSVKLLAVSCGWNNISGHDHWPCPRHFPGIGGGGHLLLDGEGGWEQSLVLAQVWREGPGLRGLEAPSQGGPPELEGGQPEEGADGEVPAREHQGEDPVQADHLGCMKVFRQCLREARHIPPWPDAAGQYREDSARKRLEGSGGAFGSTVLLHATNIIVVSSFAVKKQLRIKAKHWFWYMINVQGTQGTQATSNEVVTLP